MSGSGIEVTIIALQKAMHASDTLTASQNTPSTELYTAFIAHLEGKGTNFEFAQCSFDIYST
jgi:hypothetical protein